MELVVSILMVVGYKVMILVVREKITTRKSRDENNVWTDENSGMKQEENHFADADPKGRYPANVMHDGSDVVHYFTDK